MAEKPESASEPVEARQVESLPPIFEGAHAPILFVDAAPTLGCHNGIVNLTLVTKRITPGQDGTPVTDLVVTGHLRMSIPAAVGLRAAISDALLLAAPPSGGEPH